MAKTNWTMSETVMPADMNQIGTEINQKVNSVNPITSGTENFENRILRKFLGAKSTIQNSVNQKVKIKIPKFTFSGNINITVLGNYSSQNYNGIISKDIFGTINGTGVTNFKNEAYSKLLGNTNFTSNIQISDLRFDSGEDCYNVLVSFSTSTSSINEFRFFIEMTRSSGGIDSTFLNGFNNITISDFYADTEVLPKAITQMNQLELLAPQGTPPLKVNSTTKVDNLNSDFLDGMNSSDFYKNATPFPNGANLNNYMEPGEWYTSSSAHAATIVNSPVPGFSFGLKISKLGSNLSCQTALVPLNTTHHEAYTRLVTGSGASPWLIEPKANNPSFTGIMTLGERKYTKYLGFKTSIANSANQKMDIVLPNFAYLGTLKVTVVANYNSSNLAGNVSKIYSGIFNNTNLTFGGSTRYDEVNATGTGAAGRIKIMDPKVKDGKIVIKICLPVSEAIHNFHVFLEGYGTSGNSLDNKSFVDGATLSAFYADSEVYEPATRVEFNNGIRFNGAPGSGTYIETKNTDLQPNLNAELHNGWKRFNNLSQIGVSSGASVQEVLNAMPANSIMIIFVDSPIAAGLGLPVGTFGTVEFSKLSNVPRVVSISNDGIVRTGDLNGSHIFESWITQETTTGAQAKVDTHAANNNANALHLNTAQKNKLIAAPNFIISTSAPNNSQGANGDIWIQYV